MQEPIGLPLSRVCHLAPETSAALQRDLIYRLSAANSHLHPRSSYTFDCLSYRIQSHNDLVAIGPLSLQDRRFLNRTLLEFEAESTR